MTSSRDEDSADALARWLADFDEALPLAPLPTTTPLIITPLGLPDREVLRASLRALDVAPLRVWTLESWARCSTPSPAASRCTPFTSRTKTTSSPPGAA